MAKPMAAERTDSLSTVTQFEITDLLPLAGVDSAAIRARKVGLSTMLRASLPFG